MACELCGEEKDIYDYIYKKEEDGKFILRLSAGWDDYNDCFDYGEIEVEYCPRCGKKLYNEI